MKEQHTIVCHPVWCIRGLAAATILASVLAWAPGSRAAEIPSAQDVLRATLTNGLQVIVVRNTLASVVTTVINYRVGSDETPPGFPGTAHALEHLMFRGSPGLSADQLADVTAALGGNFNADTQPALTQYFFTTPAEDLGLALRIEATRMRDILDDEKLWDQERGAIEQEVAQDLSNPGYVFYTRLLTNLFRGTPYEHDALGTRPSFDKTTDAMLRQFHATWYRPNNAVLIIAGNVSPAKALEQVKQVFEDIPPGKLPPRPEYHFQSVQPETFKMPTDQPYGMAVIAFRFPGYDSPHFAAAQVLSDVLSSQRGKLYGLVPEGKALAAEFAYEPLPRAGLAYATVFFPAGTEPTNLLSEVRRILLDQATKGATSDLVEAAKRREIASAELEKNSVSGLAMEWSQAVALEGRQSPQEDVDAIRQITVGDVDRVAREYLSLDRAVTAVLTPEPSGRPISSTRLGRTESFAPTKPKGVKLPSWAETAVQRLEVPKSILNPTVTNLPNGIKLIVQPESVSDTVSLYGKIRNEPKVQTPPGKEGVDEALDMLFSFGTESLDRLAFQKALDDIGAIESAGVDFSVQVLSEHFERGVQLLAQNELSPALPEQAFRLIQPQLAASVAGKLQSPGYIAHRTLDRGLFPTNDPVQRQATPETIRSLTIEDVRAYHRQAFRPDLATIVVIGQISPEKAQAVVAKYFGGWRATGSKPNTLLPSVPDNAASDLRVPDASRVQDNVILAQTLAVTRTNADYYALNVANHVLGGAFYATRLYRDLREESGLVYHVASAFQVDLSRGVFDVNYACDPANTYRARAIIMNDLNEMRTNDVSAAELRQAKVLLLREIPLSESSVERIAQGWIARSMLELPLDEPIRAAHRYLELEAADVRRALAKWLRPADFVQVTQGPAAK